MKKNFLTVITLIAGMSTNSFAGSKANADLKLLNQKSTYVLVDAQANACAEVFGNPIAINIKGNSLHVGSKTVSTGLDFLALDDKAGGPYKDTSVTPNKTYAAKDCFFTSVTTTQPNLANIHDQFICVDNDDRKVIINDVTTFKVLSNSEVLITLSRNKNPPIFCDYILESALK